MPAGNVDNMKPVRTEEEARELGRRGGIKSGEVRRLKRDMKNAAKMILEMPITAKSVKDGMRQLGFSEEDLTNQMAVLVSIWKRAMEGDVKAAEFLRDTSGQKPAEKVILADINEDVVSEVESIVNEFIDKQGASD